MKRLIVLVSILSCSSLAAQSLTEWYQWGTERPALSTRSLGLADQISAIGGDLANSYYNPAGLALLNQADLGFTGGLFNHPRRYTGDVLGPFLNIDATYYVGGAVPFPLAARPSAPKRATQPRWDQWSIGLAHHQLSSWDQYWGQGPSRPTLEQRASSRLLDQWLAEANGTLPEALDPARAGLWYQLGGLVHDGGGQYRVSPDSLIADLDQFNFGGAQERSQQQQSRQNVTTLSLATRYQKRWHFGLSLHHPVLTNQTRERVYADTLQVVYQRVLFDESRQQQGLGLGAKLGVLYALNEHWRIGMRWHMPTLYWIRATQTSTLTALATDRSRRESRYEQTEQYTLVTPWQVHVSGAYTWGKRHLTHLQFSTGYVHHPGMQTHSAEQGTVRDARLQGSWQAGAGIEAALGRFRFRGGVQIESPRLQGATILPVWQNRLALGVGVQWQVVYIDLGVVRTQQAFVGGIDWMDAVEVSTVESVLVQATLGVRLGQRVTVSPWEKEPEQSIE